MSLVVAPVDHRLRLDECRNFLVAKLDGPRVAAEMFQRNALTVRELESIQGRHGEPQRAAEILLNIVRKQSYETYLVFLEALRNTSSQRDAYLALVYEGTSHCYCLIIIREYIDHIYSHTPMTSIISTRRW